MAARRRKRVTWVDWLKLALIVAIVVFPSLFIGLWSTAGEKVGDHILRNLPTTTTTTAPSPTVAP